MDAAIGLPDPDVLSLGEETSCLPFVRAEVVISEIENPTGASSPTVTFIAETATKGWKNHTIGIQSAGACVSVEHFPGVDAFLLACIGFAAGPLEFIMHGSRQEYRARGGAGTRLSRDRGFPAIPGKLVRTGA